MRRVTTFWKAFRMQIPALRDLDAVLLDMDGTIVNSNVVVERAWSAWAIENGVDPAAVLATCHGSGADDTIRRYRPDLDAETVERQMHAQLDRETADLDGVVVADGAPELLAAIEDAGVPWAVVTNSTPLLAAARLGASGITPPELVTFFDVPAGKPAPHGYLEAARRLGVRIDHCLAVEDSPSGLAAARAAGATAVDVGPHGITLHELRAALLGGGEPATAPQASSR